MRRHGEPFMAEQMREQGIACQQWLDEALRQPFDGVTLVITHFAPTLASADPRYGVTPGTAGFCNALDALLPRADYWLHGHLHCALDYMKDGCRVIANPLGYEKKGERENFMPARTWDVRTGKWRTADVPGGRLSRQRIDLRRAEFVDVERFERRGNVQRLVQLMRRVEQAMAADFLDQHVVLELPHLVGLGIFEGLHQRYSIHWSTFALCVLTE